VEENRDLFGACVQLGARVCGAAEPGQILAPASVRDLCLGKGFQFSDAGETQLKGFDQPIRLYEIKW
jgi:class 3 adenylate cyclase